jgi:hypothetical protein
MTTSSSSSPIDSVQIDASCLGTMNVDDISWNGVRLAIDDDDSCMWHVPVIYLET